MMGSLFTLGAILFAFQSPLPSEVMPAETIGRRVSATDAPAPPPPSRAPWIGAGEAGAASPFAVWQTNVYGWNIPAEMPLVGLDMSLAASNNSVVNTHYSGPGGAVDWSESRFYGVPVNTSSQVKTKWGWVAFDFGPAEFYRCTWDTIPVEHGLYLTTIAEGTSWEECSWEEVWGQAIQVVYSHPDSKRAAQTGTKPKRTWLRTALSNKNEEFLVRRCETINVGIPPLSERASFTFSFFSPNGEHGPAYNKLKVVENRMETHYPWVDVNGKARDSAGAIMAHKMRQVIIRRNYVVYLKGDRDVMQFWGCSDGQPGTEDVVIAENYILAEKPIDIRLGNANDTVIISRNIGTTEVVISTNPWFVWENNGWDESKVIYRGSLSQNIRLN